MWKEDEFGNKCINIECVEEVLEIGVKVVVVNCFFCLMMMGDGIKVKDKQEEVMVYDLVELILNNMEV